MSDYYPREMVVIQFRENIVTIGSRRMGKRIQRQWFNVTETSIRRIHRFICEHPYNTNNVGFFSVNIATKSYRP